MLYVDSSAFTKRYIDNEPHHDECIELMSSDPVWATSRLTSVESARALARPKGSLAAANVIAELDADLMLAVLVDIDRATLAMARHIAIDTQLRSLDAIHLASALRVSDGDLRILTYDHNQARVAEQLGLRLARPAN